MKKITDNRLVSIVMPVHNQSGHIGGVVRDFQRALDSLPLDHETLLVVNNSTDNTLKACRALSGEYPAVRVLTSAEGGWGRAVRRGLSEARGDVLCYTNSARTGESDLVILILYGLANPDAVIKAHRTSRESFPRKVGSFLYNLECRALFRLPAWDINATPKVFSRAVYRELTLESDGDLLDLELYLQCRRLKKVILEVPIFARPRRSGRSTTNYRSAWHLYRGAYLMWKKPNVLSWK